MLGHKAKVLMAQVPCRHAGALPSFQPVGLSEQVGRLRRVCQWSTPWSVRTDTLRAECT